MKSFRPILSIVLALLVLFTATSFSVGMHFCAGDLQNVTLFAKAPACEKEKSLPPCHQKQSKPCCEDTVVTHHAELTVQTLTIQENGGPTLLADLAFTEIVLAEIVPSIRSANNYVYYRPPLPSTDLTISHQVFLI